MKIIRKILLTSLGILPFFVPMDIANAESADELVSSANELPWSKARLMVETQTGSRSIGTLDAMVPFMGDNDFMVYANVMAKYGTGSQNANGNTFEGNLGLGFRRVSDSEDSIWGAYTFYDSLRSVNNNQFTQVTVGVERLGLTWDFRANAYLPMGKTKFVSDEYKGGKIDIEGHDLVEYIKSNTETSNAGGGIEIGRTLGSDKLRGYFAVYTFGSDLTGSRARVEYKINNAIGFNASVQTDKARGTQILVGARFTLGGAQAVKGSNSIYQRMTDPVVRDVDIVVNQDIKDKTIIERDKYFEVDNDAAAGGDGTVSNPFNNIEDAVQAAGEDVYHRGIKIVKGEGEDTRPNFLNGTIAMADNSSIQHFNFNGLENDSLAILIDNKQNVLLSDIIINNYDTGLQIVGDSSVNLAKTSFSENDVGIDVNGNVTIDGDININNSDIGLNIHGGVTNINGKVKITGGTTGINIDKVAKVNFNQDVTTEQVEGRGTSIKENSFAFFSNYISSQNETGLYLNNSSINILSGLFSDNSNIGIVIDGDADALSSRFYKQKFNNVTIKNNEQSGVQHIAGNAMFTNATIEGNGGFGVNLQSDKITLFDSHIINNKDYGLLISGKAGFMREAKLYNVNIDNTQTSQSEGDLTMEQTSGHGIYMQSEGELTLADVTVFGSSGTGIWIAAGKMEATNIIVKENSGYVDPGEGNIFQPSENEINKLKDYGYSFLNAGIRVDAGQVIINGSNNEIRDNAFSGLWANGGSVDASNVLIQNNDDGIFMTNGSVTLDSSMVFKNREFDIFLRNFDNENRAGSVTLKVNNSIISETLNQDPKANLGIGLGHGLAVEHSSSIINLHNTKIIHNGGNSIYAKSGEFTITGDKLGDSQISYNDRSGVEVSAFNTSPKRSMSFDKVEVMNNGAFGIDA